MADVEIDLEITNPQELVGLGIRAYAIGDFSNAAAAFGRATQLMAEKNGDEHDSLGEIYIHYAKSLLEVSREEAEPLGDAIPHGDEDSSSEDDTEDGEGGSSNGTTEKEEAPKEGEVTPKDGDATPKEGEDMPKEEEDTTKKEDTPKTETSEEKKDVEEKATAKIGEETEKTEQTEKPEETEEATNGVSSSKQEETPDESQENCTDLQLAWEVLEVAKRIFANRGDSGKEHLAETLILLGEVAMESENFQDGINDVKAGIEMQKELFEPTSRKLAESYYKLGIAHSTISNIDEAVECFKNSIEILKKRIKLLKESTSEKPDEKTDKKANHKNEEIEEMENLIPEIEEKIADTKSIKEEMAVKLLQEMSGSIDNKQKTPAKEEAASSSSKPNDITHLVKRKRKADDDADNLTTKKPTP